MSNASTQSTLDPSQAVFQAKFGRNLIKLGDPKKTVYFIQDDPNIIVKTFMCSTKEKKESMDNEIKIHRLAWLKANVPCPKLLDHFIEQDIGFYLMEKIDGQTVYAAHDEADLRNLPVPVRDSICNIVRNLFLNDIHYVDVQPHNFIIQRGTGTVYVIDFGHAKYVQVNYFLKQFILGNAVEWNEDMKWR